MFDLSDEEVVFYVFMSSFVLIAFIGALYSVHRDSKLKQHSTKKLAT